MTRFTKTILSSLVILGLLGTSVTAQETADGTSGAEVIAPLQIMKMQDLDFGTIAPSLTTPGTVQVLREPINTSVCGAELTCLAPGNRAVFNLLGEPDRFVNLSNPGSITVSDGNGNTMLVDNFAGAGSVSNTVWGGNVKLSASGDEGFFVVATLHVGASQPVGTYVGSFTVTASYE